MKNSFLSKFLEQYEEGFTQDIELNVLKSLVGGDSYRINVTLERAELVHPENGTIFLSMDTFGLSGAKLEIMLLKHFVKNLLYLGALADVESRKKD